MVASLRERLANTPWWNITFSVEGGWPSLGPLDQTRSGFIRTIQPSSAGRSGPATIRFRIRFCPAVTSSGPIRYLIRWTPFGRRFSTLRSAWAAGASTSIRPASATRAASAGPSPLRRTAPGEVTPRPPT